ncbi:MAG: glycerophosphodiester phosphodiesterase family protein [Anaerolineae bacterium]|nr:glycerophosphodiester phosphodiesterase family protein [Anaerolineae bacterium]MDQ7034899.1 glycerophosphodiester phosphodiesterase family protein [Anaerolineae bacterium]
MKRLLLILCFLLLVFPILAQDTLPENFDVQGHRGTRGLKPENTLPSFETALDLGVTTLELDLHYTADDVVVISHNPAVGRELCYLPEDSPVVIPTPSSSISTANPLRIRNLMLEDLQGFVCDLNQNASQFPLQNNDRTAIAGDTYHIPTLRELFELVEAYAESDLKTEEQRENARQVRFNLESKRAGNSPANIGDDFDGENIGAFELAILALVEEFELEDRVVIQSFDHRVLWAIARYNPDITLAALTNRGRARLDVYAERGASIWSPRYTEINQAQIDEAHELGLQVIPWTVNDADDMRELIAMGVDGIITDRPDILLNLDSQE